MRSIILLLLLLCVSVSMAGDVEGFSMEKVRKERGESTLVADSTAVDAAEEEPPSPFILVMRIIGSLALISVLIFGIVFGVKKTGLIKKVDEGSAGSFEVLERFPLGKQGGVLLMVRCEKSVLLLGQTADSINLLKSIEGNEAQALIEDKREGATVSAFQASLNNFITTMKSEG